MKLISLVTLLTFLSSHSSFADDRSRFSLMLSSKFLNNISHEPETTPIEYPGYLEYAVQFNVRPGWQIQGIYGKSNAANYNFAGAGFKIQTPGIFLFGKGSDGGSFARRRSPIDTSVHAELLRIFDQTDPTISTNYYISRAGFTLDWVPQKNGFYFFSLSLGTLIIRSDMFIDSGVGFGLEF